MPKYLVEWEENRLIGYETVVEAENEQDAKWAIINDVDSIRTNTEEIEYDHPATNGPEFITIENITLQLGHWGEDKDFQVSDWQDEVANNCTRLGYWEWVSSRK